MNRIFTLVIISIIAFSCSEDKAGVDKLKEERAKLQATYDEIAGKLAELDAQISVYDTTKRLPLVTVVPFETKTFAHYFEVQGQIEADKNVILFPEMGGVIRKLLVKEGDRVTKGQVLVELDTELIDLKIKELKTNMELANTTYERQKRLWDQKIGSEMQYLQAKNQKETLENNLASLEAQLQKNLIIAPFSGIVDEIWPKVGELTSPQTTVLRLVNLDKVYIKADVSEAYIGKIKEGADVEINFPALGSKSKGKVDMIGNFINPNNRTFKVSITVPNKENYIKPNLLANVLIKDFEQEDAMVIPERLIQESPDGSKFIFVTQRENNATIAKKVKINVGLSYENETIVTEGLTASATLIDKGARSIKDNQAVQVIEN